MLTFQIEKKEHSIPITHFYNLYTQICSVVWKKLIIEVIKLTKSNIVNFLKKSKTN